MLGVRKVYIANVKGLYRLRRQRKGVIKKEELIKAWTDHHLERTLLCLYHKAVIRGVRLNHIVPVALHNSQAANVNTKWCRSQEKKNLRGSHNKYIHMCAVKG